MHTRFKVHDVVIITEGIYTGYIGMVKLLGQIATNTSTTYIYYVDVYSDNTFTKLLSINRRYYSQQLSDYRKNIDVDTYVELLNNNLKEHYKSV